jgi:hypothetical protein
MKRPSYLRQLASRAAARAGAAVVVPPRSLFRADGASGFLESHKPHGDEVTDTLPHTAATSPRPSRGSLAADLQGQAAAPHGGRLNASHTASIAAREPNDHESQPTAHAPASPYSTVVAHSLAPRVGVDAPARAVTYQRRATAESTPTHVTTPIVSPGGAPTRPPTNASRNEGDRRGTPASLEQIGAAAGIVTPQRTSSAAGRGSAYRGPAYRGPGDPSPTDVSKPSSADSPGMQSAQAVPDTRPSLASAAQETRIRERRVDTMPPAKLIPQPTRPPPQAKPESHATGLYIGTLEVHLSAPPSTPPQAHPAPPRAARGTGVAARRIARGFSVFGLGQS